MMMETKTHGGKLVVMMVVMVRWQERRESVRVSLAVKGTHTQTQTQRERESLALKRCIVRVCVYECFAIKSRDCE